ncbi:MAG: DNA primase [Gammaproteobacteria bacterium PRO9]|nr:DNA primase [Gammaproteobacteria bacterium PRO9]
MGPTWARHGPTRDSGAHGLSRRLSTAVSGLIPQDFIDDLVQRADIVEVVGSRVPLTKAGREYKARCPFHAERTPSFWVSPQKGFYHCFGCGAHGTALGFLMEYERLDFPAAVEELARSLGVEVPRTEGGERVSLEPLYTVLEEAAQVYRQALRDHPAAIDYLKRRGLDGETAREFGIGYAPPAWDTLLAARGESEAARQQLLAAGLIIERDSGGHYDRFRDRIMFPIRDSRGRTVAFGGRILATGEPKYLNSPETPVFHKGRELYGLYEARRAERKLTRLLVVEGYMDVVMLAVHGIRNVVGTLGTATTTEHLRRIFAVVPEVIFCFDGDRAGRDAAWRALQVCLPVLHDGRQVRFLLLPDGEDPDSLVRREGEAAFNERIAGSLPLSRFLIETLGRDLDLDSADGKARLAALARPLLKQLPPGVYHELLAAEVARHIGMDVGRLTAALAVAGSTDAGPPGQRGGQATGHAGSLGPDPATSRFPGEFPGQAAGQRSRQPQDPSGRRSGGRHAAGHGRGASSRGSVSRQAIALLLHFPAVATEVPLPPDVEASGQRGVPLLRELHQTAAARPQASAAVLLEHFRGRPELPHLAQLLTEEPLVDAAGAVAEFRGCLDRLLAAATQQEMAALLQKADQGGLSDTERQRLAVLQRSVAGTAGPV